MASVNKRKKRDYRFVPEGTTRLGGGYGMVAARQGNEALLRRAVMSCLLWEDLAYESGSQVADNIASLIPKVNPATVADMAIEARTVQRLRHVPLLMAREMARHDTHKMFVGGLLPRIIKRADEITEFLSIYWADGPDQPISKQVKIGLGDAFANFDEYQLSKYLGKNKGVTLRDAMFMVRPKPPQGKEDLYKQLADGELSFPENTWESAISAEGNKAEVWERLIAQNSLGALAFIRNLRNMVNVGVSHWAIMKGFSQVNPSKLLPINFISAAKACPDYSREIEGLMMASLGKFEKLSGVTVFVVDVSGSMGASISARSDMSRMDIAAAMTILAAEMCEHPVIYATAGSDHKRVHQTERMKPYRGFVLGDEIKAQARRLGGGGIFTRQCLEFIEDDYRGEVDRIVVFSDSADMDRTDRVPRPFGKYNYIIDVSSHSRGVNYEGVWTAEISGWSERFMSYIAELEKGL